MKKILIAVTFLFISFNVRGQVNELIVGDRLPDIRLGNLINYTSREAKLSDFKGRLLILDFWATWCGACVGAFPKMDSLQNTYGKDIQILYVTKQPEETAKSFLDQWCRRHNLGPLPAITDDTILCSFFRHGYIPHYVWIDGTGKVIAITGAEHVTSENIARALSGERFSLPLKYDGLKIINKEDPVFAATIPVWREENGEYVPDRFDVVEQKEVLVQSTFTKYIDGLPGRSLNRPTRITCTNTSIERIFTLAFGRFDLDFTYRCVWEVDDPTLAVYSDYELYRTNKTPGEMAEWKRKYGFCYELNVPSSTGYEMNYNIMQNDLNNYFGSLYGIEGSVEKRKTKYLALVRTSKIDKMGIKDKNAAPQASNGLEDVRAINLPSKAIIENFRNPLQGYFLPLIDETGYPGMVDIHVQGNMQDLEVVNKMLEKYDLKFVEKEAVMDMVVIKSRK